MRKRSTLHCLWTPTKSISTSGISYRAGPHLRRRQPWRTRGVAALVLSSLLLVAAALNQPGPSQGKRSPVPQVVHQTPVVIVQEDILPPVMQRIAQCESRGQHFTKDGRVVRGKRNPADLGLFQINTVVWGKKAQELGYDLRTPEGNAHMARYLFENHGSVPWQSSAACWNHLS